MSDAASAWLQSTVDLVLTWLREPYAAYIVGAAFGGYTLGASKNRAAIVEISKALVYGIGAGVAIWLVQRVIIGG